MCNVIGWQKNTRFRGGLGMTAGEEARGRDDAIRAPIRKHRITTWLINFQTFADTNHDFFLTDVD
jgi:hypothetical protein